MLEGENILEKVIEYDFVTESEVSVYFKENDIPYEDIDFEMRELIYLLNKYCKIKTKFCCIGHQNNLNSAMIMFENFVEDDEIKKLIEKFWTSSSMMCQEFHKWIRNTLSYPDYKGDTIWENWIWSVHIYDPIHNDYKYRCSEVLKFKTAIAEYYNLGGIKNET